jgi:curli production assembly/transport component CsgG
MLKLVAVLLAICLSGCASVAHQVAPPVRAETPMKNVLRSHPPIANGMPVTLAIYSFLDKTGQRKPADNIANISTAVTQGGEVYLINALMALADGKFFSVVERGGLDNLIKERQIIRNAREQFEEDKVLGAMKFAGIIIEGGIIGYDANNFTGGAGAMVLGIGAKDQWRCDIVTIGLRAVSVLTGEVLLNVSTEKTILSTSMGVNVFKFYDQGTKLVEIESGTSTNEPVNYAVRQAIEQAVLELAKQGKEKGYWDFADVEYYKLDQ